MFAVALWAVDAALQKAHVIAGHLNNEFKAKKKESPVIGNIADILLNRVSWRYRHSAPETVVLCRSTLRGVVAVRPHAASCSLVQPCTASYSLVRRRTASYSLVRPRTASYSLVQPHTASYSLVRPCTVAYVFVQHRTASYCLVQHCTASYALVRPRTASYSLVQPRWLLQFHCRSASFIVYESVNFHCAHSEHNRLSKLA